MFHIVRIGAFLVLCMFSAYGFLSKKDTSADRLSPQIDAFYIHEPFAAGAMISRTYIRKNESLTTSHALNCLHALPKAELSLAAEEATSMGRSLYCRF